MTERESTSRSFFRHAATYLSANVVGGLVNAVLLAILTRLITTAEFGVYSLFTSLVTVAAIFVELNFRGAVSRYYLEYKDDFADFLRTCLLFVIVTTVAGAALTIAFVHPIAGFLQLEPVIIYLVFVTAVARVPWNLNWKLLVSQQKSMSFARLSVTEKFVHFGVVAAATFGYSQWGLSGSGGLTGLRGAEIVVVAAVAAVAVGFAVLLSVRLLRASSGGQFDRKHLKYALAFGVPLMPHALSGYVLSFFDRVVVQQIQGDAATGLYSFGYDVGGVMAAVITSMNQAWLPIFTGLRDKAGHDEIADNARKYANRVYLIAFVIVLFSREFALLLGGRPFQEALGIIPVIVISYVVVFLYTLYANYSFYRRQTALISAATIVAAAVNIILNYSLIPTYGYAAAAWTTLISYIVLLGGHYLIARWVLRERVIPIGRLLPGAVLVAAGSALAVWVESALSASPILLTLAKVAFVGAAGAAYLAYRYDRKIRDV